MIEININPTVQSALRENRPVVALESTVITHGLPYPQNKETTIGMETAIQESAATPATICILGGVIHIGLVADQMDFIARSSKAIKISRKDIAAACVQKKNGGTTVSGTMEIAYKAGIQVFATGGIGGIHRNHSQDVSADLPTLSQIPIIVVCSGAKAILDLPATREYLETSGVPVIGFKTSELPAFYSINSGIPVDYRVETPLEIAEIARSHWDFGLSTAILVTVPPPAEFAIPTEEIEASILVALNEANKKGIKGSALTPFLLDRVSEHSQTRSMQTNIALLKNNARIAALIAKELVKLM